MKTTLKLAIVALLLVPVSQVTPDKDKQMGGWDVVNLPDKEMGGWDLALTPDPSWGDDWGTIA